MENKRIKYARTYHLDFSGGVQSDDKIIESLDSFQGEEVVGTIKKDGENTTLYHDPYMHARSIDSKTNWTRDIAKKIHSVIRYDIPENWRICCENLYAKHSIYYPDGYLDGYLYLLSVWDDKNECQSYDDTKVFAELLDLPMPKEIYRGPFDIDKLKKLSQTLDPDLEEGFVVRVTRKFAYDEFSKCVTKYVRPNHVQENAEHWLKTAIPNGLPKNPSKPAFLNLSHMKKNKP